MEEHMEEHKNNTLEFCAIHPKLTAFLIKNNALRYVKGGFPLSNIAFDEEGLKKANKIYKKVKEQFIKHNALDFFNDEPPFIMSLFPDPVIMNMCMLGQGFGPL